MNSFNALQPVQSNRVLDLNRGNRATWVYSLGTGSFPIGATAYMKLTNSYGQTVGTWVGEVWDGTITFDETSTTADAIAAGTVWQLFISEDGIDRLLSQGTVIRSEAPYPDAPPQSSEYDGVRFQYSFGSTGVITDPAWRIITGRPFVYNNAARSLPNAAGFSNPNGILPVPYGTATMLYYAPLRTDAVRLTYNTIRSGDNSSGGMTVIICASYDLNNWVGFEHRQVWGVGSWDNDSLRIVTGNRQAATSAGSFLNPSGPVVVKASVAGDTANNTYYTAAYSPLDNTYRLFKGANQVLSWTDSTNIVTHGPGERHVGFKFGADLVSTSGVQVSDWLIGDAP